MWWHRERRCRTSNPGISCCLREDERRLAWKPTCVSCCLEKKTRKRASVSRLYTSRTSKYVCHVFPHKDKKVIVNACVKKCVSASLHMVLKKSRHSGCVSTKTWERACVSSWEYKNLQGNAVVFPALITIVPGNAYVWNARFFLCFLKTEIRNCFFSLKLIWIAAFARNSSHFEIKS